VCVLLGVAFAGWSAFARGDAANASPGFALAVGAALLVRADGEAGDGAEDGGGDGGGA
jgi:hypothetical protein